MTSNAENLMDLANTILPTIVPRRFQAGFATYKDLTLEHRELRRAALEWVKNYSSRQERGLVLGGVVGCGKTLLGCAILRALVETHGATVKYTNVSDFFLAIRSTWDEPGETERGVIRNILDCDVLFLDDLGAESGHPSPNKREHIAERLYLLLDEIHNNLRPTLILSTNHSLDDLAAMFGPGNGGRIISRIQALTQPLGQFPEIDIRREKFK